jgi:hypothetical protein
MRGGRGGGRIFGYRDVLELRKESQPHVIVLLFTNLVIQIQRFAEAIVAVRNLNVLLLTCTYKADGYLSALSFISHWDFSGYCYQEIHLQNITLVSQKL